MINEFNHQEFGEGCEEEDDTDDEEPQNDSWGSGFNDENSYSLNSSYHHGAEDVEDDNDDENEEDDQDVLDDPISKINLKNHLGSFLTSFLNTSHANEFVPQLNENERQILKNLNKKA